MNGLNRARGPAIAILALIIILFQTGQAAATKETPEEMLNSAQKAFWDAEYQAAAKMAKTILASDELDDEKRVEAHKILAAAYTMRKVHRDALDNLVLMFNLDRTARYSPDTYYPPPVLDNYYAVRDSLFAGTMDIKTVAVGDFENNSIYTGKFKNYDFGALENALPHIITNDLTQITDLQVVDRQRTADILRELQLSSSGFANAEQAVQTGQLLGAHTFIFGQYMLISADEIRIDARIVKTATGEVLTAKQVTGKFSGKPEIFLELEKQLITELIRTLDTSLGQDVLDAPVESADKYYAEIKEEIKDRKGYVDGAFLTSNALEAEKQGDYTKAVENWKKVLEADPENRVAMIRIKVLTPLATG